jgi:plasmid stabilization system protein ParE
MPRAPASLVKQLEWTPLAASAYLATLSYIASQDPATAEVFKARVDRALAEIVEFPAIGTPAARKYSVFNTKIRIQRWSRARQRSGV